jgi:hypothetical protein
MQLTVLFIPVKLLLVVLLYRREKPSAEEISNLCFENKILLISLYIRRV